MKAIRLLVTFVVLTGALCAHAAEPTTGPTVKKEDLPRIPPTEPRDALRTFKVRPGFHLELAAAEPNVIDPVAMCFDENGRMFVVEMRDYSERRAEKLGRIRMLEDTDGDGVYEKSTVFLDHLPWPTAVMYVDGGVLVGACPDIIFAKDTNGDGVADDVKVLFTGFGTEEKLNVQGLFNNFIWGLDNRIHGCSGHDGGMVKQALHPDAAPLDVRNKGFVINPRNWSMTTEAGGGQYGLSFDPTGRLFTCTNSSHCEIFMYDARYAARNPLAQLPDPRISIAADGPAAEVYRISPEEPWRVIRTRWRVGGLVPGPIEGGGRSAGYFTGATGITIYRGDAFPPEYLGDAFIGDAGGNLVHHKHITTGPPYSPDGIEPVARRPDDEQKIEFVASTDNWFRPVDFANAPDGCLYICDMYREVIEHPWSIPPQIKQFLDLNSGNDRGRIYRLAADGWKPRGGRTPRLSEESGEKLVKMLEHANGWHRETAARLLFERQHKSAAPALAELLMQKSSSSFGRLHALCALHGLGALSEQHLLLALRDADPVVREHAIKLSEAHPSQAVTEALASLADDPNAPVRYQLAFTLGGVNDPNRVALLTKLIQRDLKSSWMRAAILSSLSTGSADVFAAMAGDEKVIADAAGRQFLTQLAQMIGAGGNAAEVRRVNDVIERTRDLTFGFILAKALLEGAERDKTRLNIVKPALADVIQRAEARAFVMEDPLPQRAAAIALLPYAANGEMKLLDLLGVNSQTVNLAALNGLDRLDARDLSGGIVAHWKSFTPRVQNEAVALLLKRPKRALALLDAIEAKALPPNALNASQVTFLQRHADPTVKQLALKVLKPVASRESVVASFRPALDLTGDSSHGQVLYERRCISCHRANGNGFPLGPDLVTVRNGGKEKLLLSILDPNREVQPNYVAYLIDTKDGESVLGILSNDTPAAVTVRQAYGRETVIPRANIKRMTSQGKSLMPEGLEEGLSPQDVADLIAFIEAVK